MTYKTYLYYFFYKTTNNINGKYYYGVHATNNLNDSYFGSGKLLNRAVKKYGAQNFTREILKMFDNRESMYEYERNFITEDLINNKMCYNVNIGGRGGFSQEMINDIAKKNAGSHRTPEQCKHISEAGKRRNWTMSEEHRQAIITAAKTNNPSKRPEVRAKKSAKMKGMIGTCISTKWMTNDKDNVRVKESEVYFYLNKGYRFGRTINKSA